MRRSRNNMLYPKQQIEIGKNINKVEANKFKLLLNFIQKVKQELLKKKTKMDCLTKWEQVYQNM